MAYLRHAYRELVSPDPDAKATGYQDSNRSGRAGANLQMSFDSPLCALLSPLLWRGAGGEVDPQIFFDSILITFPNIANNLAGVCDNLAQGCHKRPQDHRGCSNIFIFEDCQPSAASTNFSLYLLHRVLTR